MANVDRNTLSYEGTNLILQQKKPHLVPPKKLSETDIIKMLEFLIENIFVVW